jgi:hypothetical protein
MENYASPNIVFDKFVVLLMMGMVAILKMKLI